MVLVYQNSTLMRRMVRRASASGKERNKVNYQTIIQARNRKRNQWETWTYTQACKMFINRRRQGTTVPNLR
jgi:sarcosine oxidase delta subunit